MDGLSVVIQAGCGWPGHLDGHHRDGRVVRARRASRPGVFAWRGCKHAAELAPVEHECLAQPADARRIACPVVAWLATALAHGFDQRFAPLRRYRPGSRGAGFSSRPQPGSPHPNWPPGLVAGLGRSAFYAWHSSFNPIDFCEVTWGVYF